MLQLLQTKKLRVLTGQSGKKVDMLELRAVLCSNLALLRDIAVTVYDLWGFFFRSSSLPSSRSRKPIGDLKIALNYHLRSTFEKKSQKVGFGLFPCWPLRNVWSIPYSQRWHSNWPKKIRYTFFDFFSQKLIGNDNRKVSSDHRSVSAIGS